MLALNDFHDDILILRKILRKQKEDAQQQDDDPDDQAPRGTQRNRPEQIDDEDSDGVDVEDDGATNRAEALRIKRERQQSRGPSMAPGQSQLQYSEVEDEEMDDA